MTSVGFIIKDNVLYGYTGEKKNLVIPEGIVRIAERAFSGNKDITNVTFPTTLEIIDYGAFDKCVNLKKVIIPGKVKSIDGACFERCENLKSVEVNKGVKSIGIAAFAWCAKLKSVIIMDKTCKIERDAFFGCNALQELILPPNCKLEAPAFNSKFLIPKGLLNTLPNVHPHLSDFDLVYTFRKYAKFFSNEMIAQIFLTRLRDKPIPRCVDRRLQYRFFRDAVTSENAAEISKLMIEKLPQKATQKECISVSCALVLLAKIAPAADLKVIYNWIRTQNAIEKALKIIPCVEMQYISWCNNS